MLRADSIGHRFGDRRVLTSATLRAVTGEVRVLFGRNGVGKSTLLKIACGVLRADTGMVFLDGVPVVRPSLAAMARGGVFWMSDEDVLAPSFRVGTQLTFLQNQFRGEPAEWAAKACGIADRLDQYPHQLSSGELRRAELAAAFVRQPRCLLADEPLRGVTPVDAEHIGSLFRLLASRGSAVVVTGHEPLLLGTFSDHVTWCTAGTTYELGTPAMAFAHEAFAQQYLGSGFRTNG